MRYLFGFICVLALGAMGCSGTSCPTCDGERVTDCTSVEDETACTADGVDGVCLEATCLPTDCSELKDGTTCASYGIGIGVCDTVDGDVECAVAVFDCTGVVDTTPCFENSDSDSVGKCFEELCYLFHTDCAPGNPCVFDPTGWGNYTPGLCLDEEVCTFECEVLEDGAECRIEFGGATGVCEGDGCVVE